MQRNKVVSPLCAPILLPQNTTIPPEGRRFLEETSLGPDPRLTFSSHTQSGGSASIHICKPCLSRLALEMTHEHLSKGSFGGQWDGATAPCLAPHGRCFPGGRGRGPSRRMDRKVMGGDSR